MARGRAQQVIFGGGGSIAGTVYGTIVAMATVAVGSQGDDTDAGELALLVGVTSIVLWIAHLYAHALAESVESRRRLDRGALARVAGRELAIPAAAVAPVAALAVAALGLIGDLTAVRLALAIGVATLAVQGARYAAVEELGRAGTVLSVAVNVLLGLVIVALEALVAH
jgi:hypothetical protein